MITINDIENSDIQEAQKNKQKTKKLLLLLLSFQLLTQSIWAATTKFYKLGSLYTTEIHFFYISGSSKSNISTPAWLGEGIPFPGFRLSLYPHMAKGARELCGVPFITSLIPFLESPLYDLSISQRPHFLILSQWSFGFQHRNFQGT